MPLRTLYLDVLIVINTIIDYFSLILSCHICGKAVSRIRIGAAAAIGGLTSLCILLPELGAAVQLAIGVAVSLLMAAVCVFRRDIRSISKIALSQFIISALVCGIAELLSLKDPSFSFQRNLQPYFDISPILLILATAVSYGLIAVMERLFPETRFSETADLTLSIKGRTLQLRALIDTGNLLQSTVDGKKVIIVDKENARYLLPLPAAEAIENDGDISTAFAASGIPIRYINYRTLDSTGIMVGSLCSVMLQRHDNRRPQKQEMVAVFRSLELNRDDISAIIGKQ